MSTSKDSVPTTLLTPFDLRGLQLKNRVVMSPLTRSRAGKERLANALMAEYYAQRASAGLIITEATVISKQGVGWLNSPGIYSAEQAEAWKQVIAAVHSKGGKIFLQLWHCGRASHSSFHEAEGLPVAPSAIRLEGDNIHTPKGKQPHETPRGLETEEIPLIVEDYRLAAERAKRVGFDGIEIHGANGYLLDQFLQSRTNHRADRYGGSLENRFRFLDEVVRAILTVWPAGRIGVHLSPNGNFNDMGSPDFRTTFSGPIIGNCGYTQETAEEAIKNHHADLISFGRPYISNPDLVERFAHGWPLNPPADFAAWYSFEAHGYTDFPRYSNS